MKKKFLVLGIILALVTAAAVPMAVMAAEEGTTDVTGTLGNEYSLTVPSTPQSLGTLAEGATANSITGLTVDAVTNDTGMTTVWITVEDADKAEAWAGLMYKVGDTSTTLADNFEIQGGSLGTAGWTDLSTTVHDLYGTSGSPGTLASPEVSDFGVNQPITDILAEAPASYKIVIKFTATFSP